MLGPKHPMVSGKGETRDGLQWASKPGSPEIGTQVAGL